MTSCSKVFLHIGLIAAGIAFSACLPGAKISECPASGLLTCPDGSCAMFDYQCPGPLRDRQCAVPPPADCQGPHCYGETIQCLTYDNGCPQGFAQACDDATCATDAASCKQTGDCPLEFPSPCDDGTCSLDEDFCRGKQLKIWPGANQSTGS